MAYCHSLQSKLMSCASSPWSTSTLPLPRLRQLSLVPVSANQRPAKHSRQPAAVRLNFLRHARRVSAAWESELVSGGLVVRVDLTLRVM